MRALLVAFALLASCFASEIVEHQILLPRELDYEGFERLLKLGVMLDRPERNASTMTGFVSTEALGRLRNENVAFQVVPHQGRLARARLLRSKTRALSYHHYAALVSFVDTWVQQQPTLIRKEVIGQSAGGRDLIVVRLSNFQNNAQKPQFKWVGNMHGDETVGREMLIQLIDDMLNRYIAGDADVRSLMDKLDISILISMNPDGFEAGVRGNMYGFDLNRNFPDQFGWSTGGRQPEVTAVMDWSLRNNFILSANFHGGDLVANYPWDGNAQRRSGQYSAAPDDYAFRFIATTYASNHFRMSQSREFPGGITNGAEWYVLYGGMQDWNYLNTNDMEITLELSNTKYPSETELDRYWSENKPAIYAYMRLLRDTGVRGKIEGVRSGDNKGVDLYFARNVNGRFVTIDHPSHPDAAGYFYRVLAPGTYRVTASCKAGCVPKINDFVIPPNQSKPVVVNLSMASRDVDDETASESI